MQKGCRGNGNNIKLQTTVDVKVTIILQMKRVHIESINDYFLVN